MTETVMNDNERENRIYEVGYLLLPSIPEEQLSAKVTEIKETISNLGGQFISEEDPSLRPLAYEMVKLVGTRNERYKTAYFGWVKFELDAQQAVALKVALDANVSILRYLTVKTVREDTYVPRDTTSHDENSVEENVSDEALPVVDVVIDAPAEDIDKSIDALVA